MAEKHRASYNGEWYDLTLSEWAKIISISYQKIGAWMNKGVKLQDIVNNRRTLSHKGSAQEQPAKYEGLSRDAVNKFIFSGMGHESYDHLGD